MTLQKLFLSATAAAALALSLSNVAAAETSTTNIGTGSIGGPFFQIASGTPTSSQITADFGNTITGSGVTFTDYFTFETLASGLGSGSISTSFSGIGTQLTISDVIINGTTYSAAQAEAGVSGIPISALTENTIEVQGVTAAGATSASYDGTATFTSAAPEPAAWLLMVGGIGLTGAMLRRRQTAVAFA